MRWELTADRAWPMEIAWHAQCLAVASRAELASSSHPATQQQKAVIQDTRTRPNTICAGPM